MHFKNSSYQHLHPIHSLPTRKCQSIQKLICPLMNGGLPINLPPNPPQRNHSNLPRANKCRPPNFTEVIFSLFTNIVTLIVKPGKVQGKHLKFINSNILTLVSRFCKIKRNCGTNDTYAAFKSLNLCNL
jgi:hypothetical protein